MIDWLLVSLLTVIVSFLSDLFSLFFLGTGN
jgi:hypothetical protein